MPKIGALRGDLLLLSRLGVGAMSSEEKHDRPRKVSKVLNLQRVVHVEWDPVTGTFKVSPRTKQPAGGAGRRAGSRP